MKTPFLQSTLAILAKDLRIEFRSRELLSTMTLFALLSVLVFSFAMELDRVVMQSAASGILWVTILYAVILGLNRSLASEREQGSMDAMLIAPIDRSALFVGKMLANFLFGLSVGIALLPLIAILYNVNLVDWRIIVMVGMGTLGLSAIGTLLAAMTVQTRAREALLPIVMLPAALPVLLLVVRGCNGIASGQPPEFWASVPALVAVLDLVYVVMCFFLFPYVMED